MNHGATCTEALQRSVMTHAIEMKNVFFVFKNVLFEFLTKFES